MSTAKNRLFEKLNFFISPIVIFSVFGMVINDHFFKAAFHNDLTGKLSDIFGLFFFPLFLSAGFIITAHFLGQNIFLDRKLSLCSIFIGVLSFTLLNTSGTFHDYYEFGLLSIGIPSQSTMDQTDLYCIPIVIFTYLHARRYFKGTQST